MVDRSEAQRTLRTTNGRSRFPFGKGEIISLQDRLSDLNSDILQNLEDIADIRGAFISESEKPYLFNPAWVAPLQNQLKISGFDLDISIQEPPGVSPDDPGFLPPTPLMSALKRGCQYVSNNNTSDAGYELYKLSGDGGVLFSNALFGRSPYRSTSPRASSPRIKLIRGSVSSTERIERDILRCRGPRNRGGHPEREIFFTRHGSRVPR